MKDHIKEKSTKIGEAYDKFINNKNKAQKNKIFERKNANLEILKLLNQIVENNDFIRFGQALALLKIVQYEDYDEKTDEIRPIDPFYEESVDTLKRAKEVFENLQK